MPGPSNKFRFETSLDQGARGRSAFFSQGAEKDSGVPFAILLRMRRISDRVVATSDRANAAILQK